MVGVDIDERSSKKVNRQTDMFIWEQNPKLLTMDKRTVKVRMK